MNLLILGMYPWNYSSLNDTVRSMTSAIKDMEDIEIIFLNPQAEQRSLKCFWHERQEQGIRIWNPPYSIVPTRLVHRVREKLSAHGLEAFVSKQLGKDWRNKTVMYVTASTLEQSYHYVKKLQPKRLVFDVLDDNLGFPGIPPENHARLKRMFLEISEQAEVVTAVSQYLVDQTVNWTGRPVEYLPNGVSWKARADKLLLFLE